MRIIGGRHKGRRFFPPKKNPARPTTDFAKEGLFNIIENNFDIDDVKFLDLFGGTGSISFEFGSRGCKDITTIELHGPNVDFMRKVISEIDINMRPIKMDVFKFIQTTDQKYNIIFAGPPYPLKTLDTLPDKVFEHELLENDGWFILEHSPKHAFEDHPNFRHKRSYGTTNFSIFINN